MPNVDLIREYFLTERKALLIEGKVNEEMLTYVRQSIYYLESCGSPDIELRLSSTGGEFDPGLQIFYLLKTYKGKKTGIVIDKIASMAIIILQACDRRLAYPNSCFKIHYGSITLNVPSLRNTKKLKKEIESMERLQSVADDILSWRTGKKKNELEDQYQRDEYMDIRHALAFGLIDASLDLSG